MDFESLSQLGWIADLSLVIDLDLCHALSPES